MKQKLPFDGAPCIVREGNKNRVKILVINPDYNPGSKSASSVSPTMHKTRVVNTTAEVVEFLKEWVNEIYHEDAHDKVVKWLKAKQKQVRFMAPCGNFDGGNFE